MPDDMLPQPVQPSLLSTLRRRWPVAAGISAALTGLCLAYCVAAPNQYDAVARIELRSSPLSALRLDDNSPLVSASVLSAPTAQETTAGILRSDQLAWDTIKQLHLYDSPAFAWNFPKRFPGFQPGSPSRAARAWLLGRFHGRLHVQSVPHTLLIEVRFRSKDPGLSADVVNTMLSAYQTEENQRHVEATRRSSLWLASELEDLEHKVQTSDAQLNTFREQHGLLRMPSGNTPESASQEDHNAALVEIDELSRQLVSATADRILAEAELHAATIGDPELVVASDPRLQSATSDFPVGVLQQIHAHRSELEQERAQLSAEHGPNFPRVVEIGRQLDDLNAQQRTEDARLVERFRRAFETSQAREQSIRSSLEEATSEGMKLNRAASEYDRLEQEANADHALYMELSQKTSEAGFSAGVSSPGFAIVDPATAPAKPATPNPPLLILLTLFASLWIGLCAMLALDRLPAAWRRAAVAGTLILTLGLTLGAQAPTPSTSGLPTGVAHIAPSQDNRSTPDPRQAPAIWDSPSTTTQQQPTEAGPTGEQMPAPLGPGDQLDISEYHTPEFHSSVRITAAGTVLLPMVGELHLAGLDEQQAARAIEDALRTHGMLLHPLVSITVASYAGQDVSVLGEVARPGVYPYTLHHRLLDLISAASGLSATAGRLVNIYHRDDPRTPHPVVLDPGGADVMVEHNPELAPGDTIQVSRAGLVYVIGDVIRPGGFPVDPGQGLTVVQALTLAWGPSQNAADAHAILIREQKGGRTLTRLNLRRMLHGQEPDQPIHDRDILFVPDSMAHNILNRSVESLIQSAIGVSIYSGLVYSQRY